MAHTNPTNDEELDDDPGAYVLGFGKHAGERLDSIPAHYRLWATGAECQHFRWYAELKEANDRYEKQLLQTPEAYTFSFGKHKNERLDEVPEDYIWSVIRPSFSNNAWYPSLVKAHCRYLDQVYQNKSPGSVEIWFGQQCRGYTLSLAYKRPGFIRYCLRPKHKNFKWYVKFEDLVRRYEAHLASHRRPYRRRKPANVENPVGELLGHWDDRGSVEPGDEYVRDGFVVDDGEGEDEDSQEYGGSQSDDSNDDYGFDDDFQGEEMYDDSEVNTTGDPDGSSPEQPSCASAAVSQVSESESDSNSDDDTPLDELPNKIRATRVSGKRRARVVSSPSPRRSHLSEGKGSNDDIAAQPSPKRRKGPRLVHDRPARNEFNSVAESHLDEQELSHSGSSQESAAGSSIVDESQVEDESSQINNEELSDGYIPPPSVLGGYYRPFPRVITGFHHQKMS
ncbi:uncharacterized protein F5147DRAFT_686882 [Suillus discolor]|uniref:Uncharacterized protein n=1 Tax=Suillus discolor TaxID=1912936 RepID=A0A9P7FAR4_9AGAM|nr:uncharacterized protein F5147DRAFT_686882 [Suillus discolor]KAG2111242.1 hypothetical protein F5147DRAFT_686882 [Suillus discolor]